MWIPDDNNLPYRSKYLRDKDLREIKAYHRLHPTSGPAPPVTEDTILNFGMHKGKKIKDVPVKYLKFIAKSCREGNSLYTNNIYDQIRTYVENNKL